MKSKDKTEKKIRQLKTQINQFSFQKDFDKNLKELAQVVIMAHTHSEFSIEESIFRKILFSFYKNEGTEKAIKNINLDAINNIYSILDNLSYKRKLDLGRNLGSVNSKIYKAFDKLNMLRNELVHTRTGKYKAYKNRNLFKEKLELVLESLEYSSLGMRKEEFSDLLKHATPKQITKFISNLEKALTLPRNS